MDIEKTIRNLKSFGAEVNHFATGAKAAEYLTSEIHGKSVGIGGSKTVEQLGIYEKLCETNTVSWHWKDGGDKAVFDAAANAEVYISSVNGISETGEMVLIDGRGNRVGAVSSAFEKTVYIVASVKKICPSLSEAIERAHTIAPERVLSMPGKRPCAFTGKCIDCHSPDRLCRYILVLCGKGYGQKKLEVILIDEDLGL